MFKKDETKRAAGMFRSKIASEASLIKTMVIFSENSNEPYNSQMISLKLFFKNACYVD